MQSHLQEMTPDTARAVLECLPDAVLLMDAGGVVAFVNPAAAELLGHPPAELVGASVTTFIVPQAGQRIDVVAWLARWATEPSSPQLRYLTLTGRTRSGALLRLAVRVARLDGHPAHYVVTLRDVTEQQQQQADAKHAYLLASRILAIAEDAIVNVNAAHQIDFFNRQAELLFGYRADEVLGRSIEMLLPARFRPRHELHIEAFRSGKEPARMMGQRGEIVGLTKSGDEVPLEASISKVFIDGRPTFSAQLRDIRARKAAEQLLRASERRFRTVFDHAMEAIALLDPDGVVLELNDATSALLGSNVDAVGQPFWALPWWPQAANAIERGDAQRNLRSTVQRCSAGEEIRTRTELRDAAGQTRVIDFSLRPVVDDGRTVAMIAEGRDITGIVGD